MKTLSKLKPKARFFENDFFVFDVETTPFQEGKTCEFIFGVVYGYGYTQVINTISDFKHEFEKPIYTKKKVFAHNAEFDLTVLYGNIYDLDNEAIFNGKFICASNGNCMFVDSLNIFPTSVKEIGKLLGKQKQNLSTEFWNNSEVTQKDIDYCIRDCEIIFDALLEMFTHVGNVKITLASLSLDLFRRKYLDFHIDYNEQLVNVFFNSYYGGRTEAFKIGKTNACVYDINSMYPFAMLNCKFPNPKYLKRKENVPRGTFEQILKDYEGCCFVSVVHKDSTFGCLPYRRDGKLLFPVGTYKAWYNFNEIRYAIEKGFVEVLEVMEIIYSKPMESPFKNFVLEIYKERQETESEFKKYQLKIILNSIYGKFAQRIESKFIYIHDMQKEYELINSYKAQGKIKKILLFNEFRTDCFLELSSNSSKYLYNTIPLFSSYITSFSRIQLLENLLEYENCKPVYCDTDSIFFEIDPEIKNSNDIGKFKKENKIVFEINGLKNYSYICEGEIKNKLKGIPKSATKEENKYTYYNLLKTKESLRRNINAGTYVKREKINSGKYDKRIVHAGGETEPIKL